MDLNGKAVAVTGGFGILGAAVCSAFAESGARVAALDLARTGAVADGVIPLGGFDLADEAAAEQVMAQAQEALGALDVLVNVAGGFRWEKVDSGSLDTWDLLYRMNLRTAVACCRAAIPRLSEGGAIVSVAAAGALKAGVGTAAYAASKSGVLRLTEALAEELNGRRIRVNAVLPTIIDTPQNRADMPDADASRWASPSAVAEAIVALAANDAVSGAALVVGGP